MSDQLFRSSHPGIPRQWTLIGEGGNACVWSDGSQAIKRLKEGASREAVSRFKREAEILLTLNEHSGLRIVPVQEVREREGALEIVMARMDGIPRSRHDPKILWVDDAEIVGDRITKVRPIPRNLFTQKTERRIGELGASCVALVVSDVSVHEAP